MMDCEAFQILDGIKGHLVGLSEDPSIKIPVLVSLNTTMLHDVESLWFSSNIVVFYYPDLMTDHWLMWRVVFITQTLNLSDKSLSILLAVFRIRWMRLVFSFCKISRLCVVFKLSDYE